MNFFELLNISPGVTAVIGSGGKTSLLRRLAAEAPGTVLLCTTTHIRPFAEYPLLTDAAAETVLQALTSERVLCVGTPCENGKLTAPRLPMETLAALADYMLVEAPVSACEPLCAIFLRKPGVYPLSLVKANMGRLCEKLKDAMKSGLEQRCAGNFLAIFAGTVLSEKSNFT